MSNYLEKQVSHRSIREFQDKEVEKGKLEALQEVARRTASSMGLQQASILRVTDPQKKKDFALVAKQDYVARAPEVWIFLLDLYRNAEIAREKGSNEHYGLGMDFFFQGWTDASLMAQNVMNAIEALDMGGVFIGNVLNDPKKVIEIFDLPKGVFPVVGILFGYPDQNPQLKPRMDMTFRFFENTYKKEEDYLKSLEDYDLEMQTYYDLRDANKRVDSFSNQVMTKLGHFSENRQKILDFVKEQGFVLSWDK